MATPTVDAVALMQLALPELKALAKKFHVKTTKCNKKQIVDLLVREYKCQRQLRVSGGGVSGGGGGSAPALGTQPLRVSRRFRLVKPVETHDLAPLPPGLARAHGSGGGTLAVHAATGLVFETTDSFPNGVVVARWEPGAPDLLPLRKCDVVACRDLRVNYEMPFNLTDATDESTAAELGGGLSEMISRLLRIVDSGYSEDDMSDIEEEDESC